MPSKCAFFWNGVPAEGGGNFTLQPGIAPSTAAIRVLLNTSSTQFGRLTLTDGKTTRHFDDCRVSRSEIQQGGGGARWKELTIEDKRWRWADGYFAIWGEYNRYMTFDPSADPEPEQNARSARQLAGILLEAMGETVYDVSVLPANSYPQVVWDAANPASELEDLARLYGCIVTLDTANTVRLARFGVGQLPSNEPRMMDYQLTAEPPVIPGAFVFEGGRFHIHADLPLIPVGEEVDSDSENFGKFVPLAELSYAPLAGWEATDPWNIRIPQNQNAEASARKYVWKRYQIGFPWCGVSEMQLPQFPLLDQTGARIKNGKLTVQQQSWLENYMKLEDGRTSKILPINDKRAAIGSFGGTYYGSDSIAIYGPTMLDRLVRENTRPNPGANQIGTYADVTSASSSYFNLNAFGIPEPAQAAYDGWIIPDADRKELDLDEGYVLFHEPKVFIDLSTNLLKAAPLRMRCSFPLRDPDTYAAVCPQYWQQPPNPNAAGIPKLVKNSSVYIEYHALAHNANNFVSTAIEVIAAETRKVSFTSGVSAPYNTFVFDKPPDGIIRAVVFDVSDQGEGTTHIDYGLERPNYYLTLNERRLGRLHTYNAAISAENERKKARGGGGSIRFGGARP